MILYYLRVIVNQIMSLDFTPMVKHLDVHIHRHLQYYNCSSSSDMLFATTTCPSYWTAGTVDCALLQRACVDPAWCCIEDHGITYLVIFDADSPHWVRHVYVLEKLMLVDDMHACNDALEDDDAGSEVNDD